MSERLTKNKFKILEGEDFVSDYQIEELKRELSRQNKKRISLNDEIRLGKNTRNELDNALNTLNRLMNEFKEDMLVRRSKINKNDFQAVSSMSMCDLICSHLTQIDSETGTRMQKSIEQIKKKIRNSEEYIETVSKDLSRCDYEIQELKRRIIKKESEGKA